MTVEQEQQLRADKVEFEAKKQLERQKARLRAMHEFDIRAFFFDRFTLEYFKMLYGLAYDYYGCTNVAMTITGTAYVLYMFIGMRIARSVWTALPLFWLLALKILTPNGGILAFFGILLWVFYRIIYICTREKKQDKMDLYKACFTPIPKEDTDRFRLKSAHADILVIMGIMLVLTSHWGNQLVMVGPVIVFFALSKLFPGVGGNSTAGMLSMVLMLIISITFMPQGLKAAIAVFQDITRVATMETKAAAGQDLNPTTVLLSWWGMLEWVGFRFGIGLDAGCLFDIFRMIMGEIPMLWMIIDDWFGPGYAIEQTSIMKAKNKAEHLKGTAGIYSSCNWVCAVFYVVICLMTGANIRVLVTLLSAGIVTKAWHIWGKPDWQGRGQAAAMTDARPNFLFVFGDGPSGKRRLILTFCLISSALLLLVKRFNNMTAFYAILALLTIKNERAMMGLLGVFTINFSLIGQAWIHTNPATRSITNNAVDAACEVREPG